MSLAELAAEVHEQQKWQQFEETWGHLYPKPGDHPGTAVVAHSDYGDQGVIVVHAQFEGVEDSPWFYEAMTDFAVDSMLPTHRAPHMRNVIRMDKKKKAGIWEFRGVLRVYQNGKLRFVGKWTRMSLYPGRIPATKPRREDAPSVAEIYAGRSRRADPRWRESDDSYLNANGDALVRFLDTMNQRRHGRTGMEPRRKGCST